MIKYLIKDTLVSTSKNPRGEGLVQTWWCGKRTSQPYSCTDKEHWVNHTAREYGYNRRCDAVKGFNGYKETADWEDQRGFWKHTLEIIEVEV